MPRIITNDASPPLSTERARQAKADDEFYVSGLNTSTLSRTDLKRGYNIDYARCDEIEWFAVDWMLKRDATRLDYDQKKPFPFGAKP
jgi:hypothetical protein